MALRYAYGPKGWGLYDKGIFRTPQEIGKWFGYNEKGYDQLHFEKYESPEQALTPGWHNGSLETLVKYSKDNCGNFYMDPNGTLDTMGIHDKKIRSIKGVRVPDIEKFQQRQEPKETNDDDYNNKYIVIGGSIAALVILIILLSVIQ